MSFFGGRRQQAPQKPTPPEPVAQTPTAARQPVGFETVLGASTSLKGELHSQGNVRLDGIFEGTMELDGNVLVGETAKITADINARNISIAGAVRGNVNGNKIQILRTGRVWGDINAKAITTEEGAFIDGKITMVSHEAALQDIEMPSLPAPPEEAADEPAEAEFEPLAADVTPEAPDEAEIEAFQMAESGMVIENELEALDMPVETETSEDEESDVEEAPVDDELDDEPDTSEFYDEEADDLDDDIDEDEDDIDDDEELPINGDGAVG